MVRRVDLLRIVPNHGAIDIIEPVMAGEKKAHKSCRYSLRAVAGEVTLKPYANGGSKGKDKESREEQCRCREPPYPAPSRPPPLSFAPLACRRCFTIGTGLYSSHRCDFSLFTTKRLNKGHLSCFNAMCNRAGTLRVADGAPEEPATELGELFHVHARIGPMRGGFIVGVSMKREQFPAIGGRERSTHPGRQSRCAAGRTAWLPEDACNILLLQDAGSIPRHERDEVRLLAKHTIAAHHWTQRVRSPKGYLAKALNQELRIAWAIVAVNQDKVIFLIVDLLNDGSKRP